MAEQLQLGEIERLDGLGNPLGALESPAAQAKDEQQLYQESVAAPLPEDDGVEDYLDGTVDAFTDLTSVESLLGQLPTDGQLQGAAEQYNMAMVTNSRHITPDDVMEMVKRDITPYEVQQALDSIQGQTTESRKAAALGMIGDPRLTVEAKMDLLRYVDTVGSEKDANYISKQAQVNAAQAEYITDDEPDSAEALAMHQEAVVLQSNKVAAPPVLPEDVYASIKQLYQQADNEESFLDYVEQMTPVGSLPTLNRVLSDIYTDLNLTDPNQVGDEARPWLTTGNAFVELRGMIRQAKPDQKREIAQVVFKRLKQNTGILQDHNDLVTMQVLENLFSQELFGEDPYAAREQERSPEEQKALEVELDRIGKRLNKFGQPTTSDLITGQGPPSYKERKELAARYSELNSQLLGAPTGQTIADNVFNILDWTFVGGLLKGTGKTIRSLPKLLEGMSHTSPEVAARQAAQGVLDASGEAAARLGTTPLDLADNFLTSGADDVQINRGVNGFAAMTSTMQEQARALVRRLQPTNLTAVERGKALEDISQQYSPTILAKNRSVKLHLNQSAVQLTEDGTSASVTAVFGATPYRGWATLRGARNARKDAAEDVFGVDAPVEIVQKMPDGSWRVVPDSEVDSLVKVTTKKEPPIVQFRKAASQIEAGLPAVQKGHTRLWRGNRPGETGKATTYTNDLPGIALPFQKSYGGELSYVDVPTQEASKWLNKAGSATDAEFNLPKELAAQANAVKVPETAAGAGVPRGEFFQRVRDTRSLSSSETYGTIGLADDATDKLTLSAGAAHWTRGLNIFNDFHYDQISARVRESSFSNTVWRGLMEPLTKLKTNQKQILSKIIRENEGKELSDDALQMAAGGDKKVAEGYRRFNQVGNIAYHLEDQLKRTAYQREGLSDLYHNGQRIGFGKTLSVDDAASGRRKVFDPASGAFSTMDGTDIAALYKRGGGLAKMKHPIRGQENIEDALVVLDPKAKSAIKPIPMAGVQARIPGYYPHMYNRNFIVYGVDTAGKRAPKAVSFTNGSAARYVERKNAQLASLHKKGKAKNWARYEMGFDPAISRGDTYAQHLDEVESGFSQIMFGQRSEGALKELDNWVEEAELDPVAAMLRATEVLSTRVTKGEMLQSMRQRVWNSLHTGENGQFLKAGADKKSYNQLSVDDLVAAHPDADGLKRHVAMLHRIRLMEQSPDFWESATKAAYRGMAQLSQKLGFKGGEVAAYKAAKSGPNPISLGLAWMHRMYISAFATKQLVLQVMQSVATAGMLSPYRYTQSVWQGLSIIPAVVMKTAALHGNRVPGFTMDMLKQDDFLHKAAGLSKKEYDRLIDVIIERGLIDSVGANTMVKAAINDSAENAARKRAAIPKKGVPMAIESARDALGPLAPLTRARTYDQAIFGTLNKLGWEGGERINQILSMLTLYNRDRAKGVAKLADEAYIDSLIGRTAELTGNMVKEAGFGYTNSVLKPFMLWIPFQHKMILQALPKRIGGMQRFSFDEKARMVLGQFLLYGANATAVTAAVHQAIERGVVEKLEAAPEGDKNAFVQFWRDNLTRDALEGMVFDWFGNKTMQALWGDGDSPSDMAWGRAFAPGAGHEFVREKLTALASADWQNALSVQGKYTAKMARYLSDVSNVVTARMNEADDMPIKERMGQMMQRGLMDGVPLYGKWVGARWAVAHGMFISENGTLSEPFGDAIEAKLQFLLGVDSKDREAYYDATDRLRQDFEDEGKSTKAGEQAADIYWKQLVATAVKLNKEVPVDDMWQAAMDQWIADQGLLLSALGAREKQVFSQRIERNMDRLAKGQGDSAEMVMMDKFTKKLREGGYGEEGPQAAVYFSHLPFVEKNPAFMDMLEGAWSEIVAPPATENITEDYLEGEE